ADAAADGNAPPIALTASERADDARREVSDGARIVVANLTKRRVAFDVGCAARVEVLRVHPGLGAVRIAHATPRAALRGHFKRQSGALIDPIDAVLDAGAMAPVRARRLQADETWNREVGIRPDHGRNSACAGRTKKNGNRGERGERPT